MLIQEISKGDIKAKVLTRCQGDALNGLYAAALSGFVKYLAGRYESVTKSLRSDVEVLRRDAVGGDSHLRTPEIVANLALGLRYFIAYAQDAGAMTEVEGMALWQRGWSALCEAGNRQADHQSANEPGQRFIDLLKSAIASGRAHIADADGNAPKGPVAWGWRKKTIGTGDFERDEWQPQGDLIGWILIDNVFLEPNAAYRVAQAMAGANGDGLNISARTLRKRMDEKGMVTRPGKRGELLRRLMLGGQMRSVLNLAAGIMWAKSIHLPLDDGSPAAQAHNDEKWGIPMVDNRPASDLINHEHSPANPTDDAENGTDDGNGGNGAKSTADALAHV